MGEPWENDTLPEAAFSLTCKSGKGYDADMLTVRGMSIEEFRANGIALLGEDIFGSKLAQLAMVPQDAAPAAPPAAPANNGGGNAAPAPGGAGDWRAKAPTCAHGQMTPRDWQAKSGPKAGQTQYTYFCPQPREAQDKCKPIDAISGKAWGS